MRVGRRESRCVFRRSMSVWRRGFAVRLCFPGAMTSVIEREWKSVRQQSAGGSGADVHRWPSNIASSSIFCAWFYALAHFRAHVSLHRHAAAPLHFCNREHIAAWHQVPTFYNSLHFHFLSPTSLHSRGPRHYTSTFWTIFTFTFISRTRTLYYTFTFMSRTRTLYFTFLLGPHQAPNQASIQALGTPRHTPEECQFPVFPSQPLFSSASSAGMQKGISSIAASTYWIG